MGSVPVSNELQFLRAFLARPWKIASPVPSGRTLARKIAEQIEPALGGLVLELGPGTGAVTRAILGRGIPAAELIVIESDGRFVDLLRRHLPDVRVVEGDAFAFAKTLGGEARNLRSVVCGLPVLGRPAALRRRLLGDAISALRPGGTFIQFSYGVVPPFPRMSGVEVRRAAIVWQNVPPMHIWVYRAARTA